MGQTRESREAASGGSAASVASALGFAAVGHPERGLPGSIRMPAAYCGVRGPEPPYGRVSARGVIPAVHLRSITSAHRNSVFDAALMLQSHV